MKSVRLMWVVNTGNMTKPDQSETDQAIMDYIEKMNNKTEYCIRQLAPAIPEEFHERYGLTLKYHGYYQP